MDPNARRALWGLIREVQRGAGLEEGGGLGSGRALLLTTHHLEEADALADKARGAGRVGYVSNDGYHLCLYAAHNEA
jgi:hypothetical protein